MEFFFKQKNSKRKLSSVINERYNETDKQIIKRINRIIILLKNLFEKN